MSDVGKLLHDRALNELDAKLVETRTLVDGLRGISTTKLSSCCEELVRKLEECTAAVRKVQKGF